MTPPPTPDPEDYERVLELSGLLNPYLPCEFCGVKTRNRLHCAPICPDCESLQQQGR